MKWEAGGVASSLVAIRGMNTKPSWSGVRGYTAKERKIKRMNGLRGCLPTIGVICARMICCQISKEGFSGPSSFRINGIFHVEWLPRAFRDNPKWKTRDEEVWLRQVMSHASKTLILNAMILSVYKSKWSDYFLIFLRVASVGFFSF